MKNVKGRKIEAEPFKPGGEAPTGRALDAIWGWRRENGARRRPQPRAHPALDDLSNAASEAVANNVKGTLAIHAYGRCSSAPTSTCTSAR